MMDAAKPWMKFYPQDWRADERLRNCSLAARGLWIEMLAVMHRAERYGYLLVNGKAPTDRQLAIQVGADGAGEVTPLLAELEGEGVFSRDRNGVIYSRRMIRDNRKAAQARDVGKTGGNPKLKGSYNRPGFVYLMGPRADGAYKIGISTNPQGRLKKIRAQYRGQDIALVDSWACDDMGALEGSLHAKFRDKASGEWFFLTAANIGEIRDICGAHKGPEKGREKGRPNPQRPEARKKDPSDPKKTTIPDDWEPEPFGEETQCRSIVDGWDEAQLKLQVERFKAHHTSRGNRFKDWQAAWKTWVLNSTGFAAPRLVAVTSGRPDESAMLADIRARKAFEAAQAKGSA